MASGGRVKCETLHEKPQHHISNMHGVQRGLEESTLAEALAKERRGSPS